MAGRGQDIPRRRFASLKQSSQKKVAGGCGADSCILGGGVLRILAGPCACRDGRWAALLLWHPALLPAAEFMKIQDSADLGHFANHGRPHGLRPRVDETRNSRAEAISIPHSRSLAMMQNAFHERTPPAVFYDGRASAHPSSAGGRTSRFRRVRFA